jgi:beta-mannosidase
MRIWLSLIFGAFFVFSGQGHCQHVTIPLEGPWYWQASESDDWKRTTCFGFVPCGSSGDQRHLEVLIADVGSEHWLTAYGGGTLMTRFVVDDGLMGMDRIELVTGSFACNATIYVNDSLLPVPDPANTTLLINNLVHPGENELRIVPVSRCAGRHRVGMAQPEKSAGQVRVCPVHADMHGSGTGLIPGDSGAQVCYPTVLLQGWHGAMFRDISVVQVGITEERAELDIHVDLDVSRHFFGELTVRVDGEVVRRKTVDLRYGRNRDLMHIVLEAPRLWWPHDMGVPYLYDIRVQLVHAGVPIAEDGLRKGLRTAAFNRSDEVETRPGEMVMNGRAMTVKGAEYLAGPMLGCPGSAPHLESILKSAKTAGINTLLVSEPDVVGADQLYSLCDALGLVVWQGLQPGKHDWVRQEASMVPVDSCRLPAVQQIMNHTSVVAWFDSNAAGRPRQSDSSNPDSESYWLIPAVGAMVLDEATIAAFYRGSSNPAVPEIGDETVDGLGADLSDLSYGSQRTPLSLPSKYTVQRYADVNAATDTLEIWGSLPGQAEYLEAFRDTLHKRFGPFSGPHRLAYYSQVAQAEFMKHEIERRRLHGSKDAGIVYCRINEEHPGVSDAAIDFGGVPKAIMYQLERSLKPVLVGMEHEGDRIKVFAANDRDDVLDAVLEMEILHVGGKVLFSHTNHFRLRSGHRERIFQTSLPKALKRVSPDEFYVRSRLVDGDTIIAESRLFLVPFGDLDLPDPQLTVEVTQQQGAPVAVLKTVHLAPFVHLSCPGHRAMFKDNFFFLDPGSTRTVAVEGVDPEVLRDCLHVEYISGK